MFDLKNWFFSKVRINKINGVVMLLRKMSRIFQGCKKSTIRHSFYPEIFCLKTEK